MSFDVQKVDPEMPQRPRRNWSEAERSDPEDPTVGISRGGAGVNLNWKALVGIITAAVLATMWCVNIANTSAAHTVALGELKADFRNVNYKVNALLINRGLNPQEVVEKAAAADSVAPTRP